jgi:hypothetical protein
MSGRDRCNEIMRLIDEALAEHEQPAPPAPPPARPGRTAALPVPLRRQPDAPPAPSAPGD